MASKFHTLIFVVRSVFTIGCSLLCCQLSGAEPKEVSDVRLIDAARELDRLEGESSERLSFDSPGVKEVEDLIREDVWSNRGRGSVVILSEWDPGSMAWEVAAQTILYRMANWEAVPMEEGDVTQMVDLAVMVDLFKATIRKNDKSGDYPQRRGRIGSPYTFRNFYADRLVQAANGPGASLNVKEVYDDPNKWLDDVILSRSGPLPSVLNEQHALSRLDAKTRPPKVASFPKAHGDENLKEEKSTGPLRPIVIASLVIALILGVMCFGKGSSKAG